MSDTKMVTFTPEKLAKFKEAYGKAKRNPLTDTFEFEGDEYVLRYAAYMIEYLEGRFDEAKQAERVAQRHT